MTYPTNFQVFKLTGADTSTFLQGQLSNDVNVNGINAYCSPKGDVLAVFILIRESDDFYLLSQDENIADTIKRLSMFVLRSDVKIEKSSLYPIFANSAPQSSLHFKLPKSGYIILQEKASESAQDATPLLMQNGFIRLSSLSSGTYVPQFLNMDCLGALNWQKGCYVGQEVIARLHYRGKVTKRCFLIESDERMVEGAAVELQNAQKKPVRGVILQVYENFAMALLSCKGIEEPLTLNNATVKLTSFHEN